MMTKCSKIRFHVSVSGPMVLWFENKTIEVNQNANMYGWFELNQFSWTGSDLQSSFPALSESTSSPYISQNTGELFFYILTSKGSHK